MLATSRRSCSARFRALVRCRDSRVYLLAANFHFLFDDGLDDSIAEVDVFLAELGHLAIQVSENLIQMRHYFPHLDVCWVAGIAIFPGMAAT
jgi:hypothetical protein